MNRHQLVIEIPQFTVVSQICVACQQGKQTFGKLIHLTHTCFDISYSTGIVSQFMIRPQVPHMQATQRTLRYLDKTINYGILYKRDTNLQVLGFVDVDWVQLLCESEDDTRPDDLLSANPNHVPNNFFSSNNFEAATTRSHEQTKARGILPRCFFPFFNVFQIYLGVTGVLDTTLQLTIIPSFIIHHVWIPHLIVNHPLVISLYIEILLVLIVLEHIIALCNCSKGALSQVNVGARNWREEEKEEPQKWEEQKWEEPRQHQGEAYGKGRSRDKL
nr:hypothetical protein PHYPA_002483 [Physcomitrium patens]